MWPLACSNLALMWKNPNEGQTPAPPSAAAPSTPASQPPAAPLSRTVFGKSMKVVGEISSDEELFVDGELEGKVDLRNRLTVGPGSNVRANIKAKEVVVYGTVKGNVESETRVSLRAGASIVGDIKTAGIVIDDGAYFKGGIDITRGEAASSAKASASGASTGQKR